MPFQELIKNFDRIRGYMRDFFIYGCKTRSDREEASLRTYDNERRRIESYLGDYMCFRLREGGRGKRVWLSMESAALERNPFYQAYRSKSFTDNDIILHFYLLEALSALEPPQEEGWTAGQLTDLLSQRYGLCFDVQTVRGKLREYESLEKGLCLLASEKHGKSLCYRLNREAEELSALLEERRGEMEDFLAFFSEVLPFGAAGSYLMERGGYSNPHIRFKHHFLSHTLDDNLLLSIIEGIASESLMEVVNYSRRQRSQRDPRPLVCTGVPVAVLVSVQTGRRYLVLYGDKRKKLHSFRLDYIRSAKILGPCPPEFLEQLRLYAEESLNAAWGASISWRPRREYFSMELYIDEKREKYILNRLMREGRGGEIQQVGVNRFRYSIETADTNELMEWVKSFTGRICKLDGSNRQVIQRFYRDMKRMEELYGDGEGGE